MPPPGIGLHPPDGGDEDDGAAPPLEHDAPGRLGAQEITLEADVHHPVPVLLGQLLDPAGNQLNGAADQAVDPAESPGRISGHPLRVRRFRGVHLDEDGLARFGTLLDDVGALQK